MGTNLVPEDSHTSAKSTSVRQKTCKQWYKEMADFTHTTINRKQITHLFCTITIFYFRVCWSCVYDQLLFFSEFSYLECSVLLNKIIQIYLYLIIVSCIYFSIYYFCSTQCIFFSLSSPELLSRLSCRNLTVQFCFVFNIAIVTSGC